MPVGLILVVTGLVLVFATSLVTLGWILFGIGAGIIVLNLVLAVFLGAKFKKEWNKTNAWIDQGHARMRKRP